MNNLDNFYLNKEEPNRSCLLALRKIILDLNCDITETKKYGMPCFCYKNKMLCYLWTDKHTEEPYILFVDGNLLDYPQLEKGTRSRMKILRIDSNQDLPLKTIHTLLDAAINLHKKSLR